MGLYQRSTIRPARAQTITKVVNLWPLLEVQTDASSSTSGFGPERALDGDLITSWFTANADAVIQGAVPFFKVIVPVDSTVTKIRLRGNRPFADGFDFCPGRFDHFDVNDSKLFTPTADLPAPDRDLDLRVPRTIAGVRRVRFTALADESIAPGFAELEVIRPITIGTPTAPEAPPPSPFPVITMAG